MWPFDTKMKHGFDIAYLIELVSQNPCIWDKTAEGYHSKEIANAVWRNICTELFEQFDELPERQKEIYEKEVSKKWRNVRDQWLKMTKKMEREKRSGSTYRSRPYIHYDSLGFLNKTLGLFYTKTDPDNAELRGSPAGADTPGPSRRKTKAAPIPAGEEEVVRKKAKIGPELQDLHSAKEEDPKVMFFKGILPHMSDFTDDENLRFQSGVLQLIQTIRKERFSQTIK